jgi:hypothetical protein
LGIKHKKYTFPEMTADNAASLCKQLVNILVDTVPYLEIHEVIADTDTEFNCVVKNNVGGKGTTALRFFVDEDSIIDVEMGRISNGSYVYGNGDLQTLWYHDGTVEGETLEVFAVDDVLFTFEFNERSYYDLSFALMKSEITGEKLLAVGLMGAEIPDNYIYESESGEEQPISIATQYGFTSVSSHPSFIETWGKGLVRLAMVFDGDKSKTSLGYMTANGSPFIEVPIPLEGRFSTAGDFYIEDKRFFCISSRLCIPMKDGD